MSINYIVEHKYANGLTYYTDREGNPIDYEKNYTYEEQYYIDTTPEERAADNAAREAGRAKISKYKAERGKMFLRNEVESLEIPAFAGTRQTLWGQYWAERELCVVAGDTGVGKTTLGLTIAQHLAGGRVLGVEDNVGRPRTVLYIDFELDTDDFYARYGHTHTLEHLHWAGYNKLGYRPGHLESAAHWFLDTLDNYLAEHPINAIIVDQPDRLHLTQQQWDFLLRKLKELTRTKNIGIMLIVNTKPRNYSRPLELTHIYNHRRLSFDADSIIAIGADYKNAGLRYIKPLKIKNRPLWRNRELEGFIIDGEEQTLPPPDKSGYSTDATVSNVSLNEGDLKRTPHTTTPTMNVGVELTLPERGVNSQFILQIFLTAPCPEEDYLKPDKSKLREQKMIAAESMRKDGMFIDNIAIELNVPEGTVKRWVAGIKALSNEGHGASSPLHTYKTPPPYGHPLLEGDFMMPKVLPPDWEHSVNNPDSPNYDPFAYNPYLIENEQRELGMG